MTFPNKILIRQSMIKKRNALTQEYIIRTSKIICETIKLTTLYQQSKNIAFYYPFRGEVCLKALWDDADSQGKTCFFPVSEGTHMDFLPAVPTTEFLPSQLGVLEPSVEKNLAIDKEKLDLVLMPLVCFDTLGMRLGMGKGFYDRAFEFEKRKKSPFLLGVAYEFQKFPLLEKQPWDVLLNAIATENKVYCCSVS